MMHHGFALRQHGCHVSAEALGQDYATAVDRVEKILLPAFDSWRSNGLTDMIPACPVPGTFDWLVGVFKGHQKWKEIDHKTQRLYHQGRDRLYRLVPLQRP